MNKPAFLKTLLLFFLILILSLSGFSKEKTITSNWIAVPPIIDGSYDEWRDDVFNFEKKVSVDYAFKNDAENFYIIFIFKDPRYLSSINATGMTLWFNNEGKKEKKYGIKFIKKQVSVNTFISILEQQKGTLSEEEKNKIRANPYFFLHNTKVISKKNKSISQPSDSGEIKQAVFRSMKQEKMIVYEFAIPLKRMTEKAPGIGTEPGKIIKVGFEWGGLTKEMKESRVKRLAEAGVRLEQADRPGGSWSKGSSYGRGTSGLSQSAKKYSFWVDVHIAQNH